MDGSCESCGASRILVEEKCIKCTASVKGRYKAEAAFDLMFGKERLERVEKEMADHKANMDSTAKYFGACRHSDVQFSMFCQGWDANQTLLENRLLKAQEEIAVAEAKLAEEEPCIGMLPMSWLPDRELRTCIENRSPDLMARAFREAAEEEIRIRSALGWSRVRA